MEVQNLMKELRADALDKMEKRSPEDLAASWSGEDLLYSGKGNAIFIVLPTPGCAWALSGSGGCTMCSYVADSPLDKVDPELLVDIFNKSLKKHEINEKTVVKIFASGSFLNPNEIPQSARNQILNILKDEKYVEEVVVESRPNLSQRQCLKSVVKHSEIKYLRLVLVLKHLMIILGKKRLTKDFQRRGF